MKKEILSMILLNTILFFTLVFTHEISHLGISSLIGCKSEVLSFDFLNGYAYSKLSCSQGKSFVYLSGLLPSIFLSSLSFFKTPKNLLFLIFGFSIILSSLDISILLNPSYFYFSLFLGLLLISVGEYKIASDLMEIRIITLEIKI
ncbi:MAG: hypothetical protein QW140_01790 [Candidatus Aenigmatarchaeota archaeon]